MDKITNLLNPGKHDDEVLYGSGNSSDPLHSGTTGTTGTTGATGTSGSTTGTTGLGSSTTGTSSHDTSNTASGLGSGTTRTHDPLTSTTGSALGATSGRTAGAYDDDTSSTTAIKGGVPGTNTHSGSALTDTNTPLPNEPGRLGTFGHLEEGGRQNEPFSSSTGPTQTTGTTDTGLTGGHHTGSGLIGSHDTTYPTTGTSTTSAGTDHSSRALPDRSVGGSTTGTGSKTDEILGVAATRGERGAEEIEDPKHRQFPQSTSDNTASSAGPASSVHHPSTTSSGLGSTTDPTNTGSHLGRDAGLGGAALGGAGLAEHEHNRGLGHTTGATNTTRGTVGDPDDWEHSHTGHGHTFEGDPCGSGVPRAGPHFVEGPHVTDTANRLDPHADTTGPHTHGSSTTGTGLESTDKHNTGRDTALAGGAGVAGVAAVGAHEEGRHHHHDPTSAGTTSTETDPSLTGPVHKSSLLNKLDPRVKSADTTGTTGTTGTSSEHHHGRDTAGGAALGATGYEAEKHHHHKDHADPTSATGPTTSTGLTGSTEPTSSTGTAGISDRHLGRDAAGGAAVGAAGYEAEKHHHHKEHTNPTNTTGTTGTSPQYGTSEPVAGTDASDKHHHSHHDKETHHEKKHEKEHEKDHEKKHGGLLGFLHRDKTNKAEEPKHQDTTHHHGRDAATTGAVGAGAASVAEHEHEKHERNRLHKDPPASMRADETGSGYGEKPTSGYASEVTGGTGTTALAQGDNFHRGSHLSGVGNKLDPAVADPVNAPGAGVAGDRAVDPVTGLPVDTSRKFEGSGTDDIPHHGTTGAAGPLGTDTNATPGGPLTSRREDATGDQLTAGGKYHDPANMGYGEGLTSSTGATGTTGTTGTHHGLSSGAPHTGPSGSTGI